MSAEIGRPSRVPARGRAAAGQHAGPAAALPLQRLGQSAAWRADSDSVQEILKLGDGTAAPDGWAGRARLGATGPGPCITVAGPIDPGCLFAKLGSCYAGVDAVRDKLEPGWWRGRADGPTILGRGPQARPMASAKNDGWFGIRSIPFREGDYCTVSMRSDRHSFFRYSELSCAAAAGLDFAVAVSSFLIRML